MGSGNRVQTSAPSDVFATRDGHLLTHVVGNAIFRRWAQLMGDAAARGQSTRATAPISRRGDHSEEILARMRSWSRGDSTAQAVAELERAGIPGGRCSTPQQALDDPQVAAMGLLKSVADYPGLARPAQVCDLPVSLSRLSGGIRNAPPRAGEHTDCDSSVGLSAAEITALSASGVTG